MPIQTRNIGYDSDIRTEYLHFNIGENSSTAAILDASLYIPMPYNCRVVEIAATHGVIVGAGNSGSTTLNFYRAGSATVASATTTSLLASGGISFSSGTAAGGIVTATLNTAQITGKDAGMLVSAGTTLLVLFDTTATSAVNHIRGYLKVVLDD